MHSVLESCDRMNEQATAQLAGRSVVAGSPALNTFQKFVPISEHFFLSFTKLMARNFQNFSCVNFPENQLFFWKFSEKFHRKFPNSQPYLLTVCLFSNTYVLIINHYWLCTRMEFFRSLIKQLLTVFV